MAHFAELNSNNIVLRVVVACNQDIANNGGELSEQAAKHFENVCPLSENGVRWMQTSYNSNFRGAFAGKGMKYFENLNMFLISDIPPYPSWTLNSKGNFQPPIPVPSNIDFRNLTNNGDNTYSGKGIEWNEEIKNWNIFNIKKFFDESTQMWKTIKID